MLLDSEQYVFTINVKEIALTSYSMLPHDVKNWSLPRLFYSFFFEDHIALKISDFSIFFWKLDSSSKNDIKFYFPQYLT